MAKRHNSLASLRSFTDLDTGAKGRGSQQDVTRRVGAGSHYPALDVWKVQDILLSDLSSLPGRHGRFDLDGAGFAEGLVPVAAPGPVFGLQDKSAMDWIAVDVFQLFDTAKRWPDGPPF